jgi:hypothetical protein
LTFKSNYVSLVSGRIEYNTVFSKTAQGGAKNLCDSKWLVPNSKNPEFCPVRLYKSLLNKRTSKITTNRLFLTPNSAWQSNRSTGWFKNIPVGRNELSKWTKDAAQKTGMNTTEVKISNHSMRSTAVTNLAKAGVGEQQLIKITGHSKAASIQPYLQMDSQHHSNIITALRTVQNNVPSTSFEAPLKRQKIDTSSSQHHQSFDTPHSNIENSATTNIIKNNLTDMANNTPVTYNNCNFYINCNLK